MRKKLAVLVATMLVALMLAVGPALAVPGKNGKGAAHANPNASFGITTAIANSSGGGCDIACPQ